MSEHAIRALPIWNGPIQVEPLEGGITNINYRVTDGEDVYAVRSGSDDPKLGIDRANERACTRWAAEIDVAPALVHAAPGMMVSAFVESTPLSPELAREPGRQARVVQQLRRIHDSGVRVTGHLQYFSVFQVARTYIEIAWAEGLQLPVERAEALLDQVRDLEARIEPFMPTFCHNDLMPGNLLDTGQRVWVIDWEYAGIGHPLFDLAGLASNCDFDADQDHELLAAYFGDPSPALRAQLGMMKAMAALRESLWAVVQAAQSEIDFDYAGYRDDNYRKFIAALNGL